MLLALAADLILLLHLAFIVFVVLGGLLALRWPRVAWLHLPAVLWGALIELSGQIVCPLTPLEQALRETADGAGYAGGFIEHYLVPLIYPAGLTRDAQITMGIAVLGVNAIAYGVLYLRHRVP